MAACACVKCCACVRLYVCIFAAHAGYHDRFVNDCCIALSNGKVVRVKQAPSAKQGPPSRSQRNKKQQAKHTQQQQQQAVELDKQSDPALTGST